MTFVATHEAVPKQGMVAMCAQRVTPSHPWHCNSRVRRLCQRGGGCRDQRGLAAPVWKGGL